MASLPSLKPARLGVPGYRGTGDLLQYPSRLVIPSSCHRREKTPPTGTSGGSRKAVSTKRRVSLLHTGQGARVRKKIKIKRAAANARGCCLEQARRRVRQVERTTQHRSGHDAFKLASELPVASTRDVTLGEVNDSRGSVAGPGVVRCLSGPTALAPRRPSSGTTTHNTHAPSTAALARHALPLTNGPRWRHDIGTRRNDTATNFDSRGGC